MHHTEAHLADAVAHILTDLGPSYTADSLAERLKRIQTACSKAAEAAASPNQPEQPISQDTINTINNLLPPSSRDIALQDKAPLLRLIQKASLRALNVLAEQKAQYLRNMRIFHQPSKVLCLLIDMSLYINQLMQAWSTCKGGSQSSVQDPPMPEDARSAMTTKDFLGVIAVTGLTPHHHIFAPTKAMPFAVIGSEKDVKTQDGRVLKAIATVFSLLYI